MSQENPSASPWIVNTTAESFDADVFERSNDVPVLVDFWAEWCAPCRMLGPILERLATEYDGRFVLVKADTEQLPKAAAEFQVQSIPAVYSVVGGEIVDFFMGALPEREIRERIERMLRSGEITRIRDLEASAPAEAEAAYRRMLEQSPGEATASTGLARVLLDQGQVEEARVILDQLESRGFLEPEAETLKASLQLAGKTDVDLAACRKAAEKHPDDLELQLSLAEALAGDEQYQAAMDTCLQLVERDRQGVGEQARQVMLDIFRVLPEGSELVPEYRRRLAMLLY